MTIDEKIKQAAENSVNRHWLELNEADARVRKFEQGANFLKSEMLADMQKLAEALKFYANMAKDDDRNLDDCLERACINRAESKEYNLGGKYVAEKAVKALAEFNEKYKGEK